MKCCELVSRLLLIPVARRRDEQPPAMNADGARKNELSSNPQLGPGCGWSEAPLSARVYSSEPTKERRLTLPDLHPDGVGAKSSHSNRSRSSSSSNSSASNMSSRSTSRRSGGSASAPWTSSSASASSSSSLSSLVLAERRPTTCWQSGRLRSRLGKRQSTCDCPNDVSQAAKSNRVWPSVHSFSCGGAASASNASDVEASVQSARHALFDPDHTHNINNGHRLLTRTSLSLPLLLLTAASSKLDAGARRCSSHHPPVRRAHSVRHHKKSVIVLLDSPPSTYLLLGDARSWNDQCGHDAGDSGGADMSSSSDSDPSCSVERGLASTLAAPLTPWMNQSRSAPCSPRRHVSASSRRRRAAHRAGLTRSSDAIDCAEDPADGDSGAPSSMADAMETIPTEPLSSVEGSVDNRAVHVAGKSDVGVAPLMGEAAAAAVSAAVANSSSVTGRRFKLLAEGDIQLCRLTHSGTVINKILSSKFLRRWETHHLFLNDACLSSKTPSGFMENSVPYSLIKDVNLVMSWDGGHRHCLRIIVPDGSILLQANNSYIRDQWYHSIIWKKNVFRYHQVTRTTTRQEVLLKEIKNMVELATTTPLQDNGIAQAPFQLISSLLATKDSLLPQTVLEDLLSTLSPLLERQQPSEEMCTAFSRHCQCHPRSSLVRGLFTSIVQRILKHNVDFGKYPYMRRFVQDYIRVLCAHNDGPEAVKEFVRNAHGEGSACPHPRVLPNLVAVCLASVFNIYDDRRRRRFGSQRNVADAAAQDTGHQHRRQPSFTSGEPQETLESGKNIIDVEGDAQSDPVKEEQPWDIVCYLNIIQTISEFSDWRPGLAQLLQPIPYPDDALADEVFIKGMMPVIGSIGNDQRCGVHQCVLGIREGKEGWFHVICPSSAACTDDGTLWASILQTLLNCCCRRKKFLASMTKLLGACQLLALRDQSSAQEVLCLMLEWSLLDGSSTASPSSSAEDVNTLGLQVVTTLQSTESGRRRYMELCDRQLHLKELQQKGGPKKLTLPNRSTDSDLVKLLSCGSFGNLECLSLAFTQVTSACAEHLIKLPSLRYLNLWCTQFGDAGLALICEHLQKLQVLNLCETPVTDKGLDCLSGLKSLRKLNLNSTSLSVMTFENLKQKLPSLQECDVRYTDAW